jgi:hypothetical protein
MQNTHTTAPRVAIPWRGLLAVAGLTLALLIFLALRSTFDPLARQEAARQAERQAEIDAQLTWVDVFVAALWRTAPPALALGLLGAAGYVGLVIAYRRWADTEIILKHHETQLARATEQKFPMLQHLSLSQSQSYHDSSRPQLAAPTAEPEAPPQLPSPIPTFGELLDQGTIGPSTPLLLGFDATTGEAIKGSWDSLYSCGIGALQGAGKSWLAAFLLCQSALQGGKLIVCDPHAGDDESLATRIAALSSVFLCDVASDEREILAALQLAKDKLERRKAGHAARWPIIIVVDEWTSLLRGSAGATLPDLALDIAEQGRKYNINALLAAQGWTKARAGGDIRNRLTSHYVLRQRRDEARYQLDMDVPDDMRTLPDATGYLLAVKDDLRKIVIPRMTTADIERVGTMLATTQRAARPLGFQLPQTVQLTPSAGYQQATAANIPTAPMVASGKPDGSLMVASADQATTAAGRAQTLSPEAARVRSLFLAGQNLPAIVKELRGVRSNEGRRYQEALTEITNLLRQGMEE